VFAVLRAVFWVRVQFNVRFLGSVLRSALSSSSCASCRRSLRGLGACRRPTRGHL